MPTFTVEDFVRQRLGDTENKDYFPGVGELTNIVYRHVVSRTSQLVLDLTATEIRLTPLPTPGVSTAGEFWIYQITQYQSSVFNRVMEQISFDSQLHQPSQRYGLFQTNVYLDDVFLTSQPDIDEINLSVEFSSAVSGKVQLRGYVVNISRLMHDVFIAIADDINKLAIRQSSAGGSVNLIEAGRIAREQAQAWLIGTMAHEFPGQGARNRRHGHGFHQHRRIR